MRNDSERAVKESASRSWHTDPSFLRRLYSRPGVRERAELRILSRVVVLESGSLEARHGRHTEFRALRGEAGGLVQVQLFFVTRHGVLDPREGQVVDLPRVDTNCGPNPVETDVEWRHDGGEPAFGDGREHSERAASFSLAERFERLPLRGRRPAVDEHELRAMAEVDRPGPYPGQSDAEAVELHVPVGALVDDPGVHASAAAVRWRSVEAARASPVAVALTQEGSGHPPLRDHGKTVPCGNGPHTIKGRRPPRGTNGLQGPTSQRTTDPGLLS